MPGYIGYTPEFQPISLQEYLTVPMMILESRKQEAEKAEEYKDKLSYYRDLIGPEGKDVFSEYDKLFNEASTDIYTNNTQNLASASKRLRDALRNIGTKIELAKENRDKYADMMAKDPSLIGDIGSMYEWYKDPYRNPKLVSAKDLEAQIGNLTKNTASGIQPEYKGYDDKTGLYYYESGIKPDIQKSSVDNAISGNITNDYERGIRNYLDSIGYGDMSDSTKRKVENAIRQSVGANSGYGLGPISKLDLDAKKASTSLHNAQASSAWESYRNNKNPEPWDDLNVTTKDGRHYRYNAKKHASGYLEITRTPINEKGKAIGKPEPAPYYYRQNGDIEYAEYSSAGLFGKTSTSDEVYVDTTPIAYTTSDDGKLETADVIPSIDANGKPYFDDKESFREIDFSNDKEVSEYNKKVQEYLKQGYSMNQIHAFWDDRKNKGGHGQRVIIVVTGANQQLQKDTKRNQQARKLVDLMNQPIHPDFMPDAVNIGVPK